MSLASAVSQRVGARSPDGEAGEQTTDIDLTWTFTLNLQYRLHTRFWLFSINPFNMLKKKARIQLIKTLFMQMYEADNQTIRRHFVTLWSSETELPSVFHQQGDLLLVRCHLFPFEHVGGVAARPNRATVHHISIQPAEYDNSSEGRPPQSTSNVGLLSRPKCHLRQCWHALHFPHWKGDFWSPHKPIITATMSIILPRIYEYERVTLLFEQKAIIQTSFQVCLALLYS